MADSFFSCVDCMIDKVHFGAYSLSNVFIFNSFTYKFYFPWLIISFWIAVLLNLYECSSWKLGGLLIKPTWAIGVLKLDSKAHLLMVLVVSAFDFFRRAMDGEPVIFVPLSHPFSSNVLLKTTDLLFSFTIKRNKVLFSFISIHYWQKPVNYTLTKIMVD